MNLIYKIAITEEELKQAFALRIEVFVDEQRVPPNLELDELDKTAIHFIALNDSQVVGCGRIVMKSDHAHIGRVAVKKCYRKGGVGKGLMLAMMDFAKEKGAREVILHSQIQVIPFYESLGFTKHGKTFMDAGIEHIEMSRSI
jgi:predicted GNAT family N-acyltransferase